MSELLAIKNTVTIPQSIVFKGVQFTLGAFEEQTFDADVAKRFLEMRGPIVVPAAEAESSTFAPDLQSQTVWVANMTGMYHQPAKLKVRRAGKGNRFDEVEIDNPNAQPRTISREKKGGHRQVTAKDGGLVQYSLASKMVTVPPFKRRPLSADEAWWFIGRDTANVEGRGAAVTSRAPAPFEPSMQWQLDEMRTFVRLCDPDAPLGEDAAAVALRVKLKHQEQFKSEGLSAKDIDAKMASDSYKASLKTVLAEELRKAKQVFFNTVVCRYLFDPEWPLPTREEFDEFTTGRGAADVVEQELEAVLARADQQIKKAENKLTQQAASK